MNELKFNIKLNRLLPLSYEGDTGYQRVRFEGFEKLSETSTVYLYMDKHDPIPLVGLEFDVDETVTASYGQFDCQLREMDGENLVHSSNQFKAIVRRWIGEPSEVVNPRVEATLWYKALLEKIDAGVSDEKIGEEVRKYLEEHPVVSEETDPVYSADKPFLATKKELNSLFEDLDNLKENGVASSDIEKAVSDYLKKNPVGGLTESQVNTLIDNKLGVIENGTY